MQVNGRRSILEGLFDAGPCVLNDDVRAISEQPPLRAFCATRPASGFCNSIDLRDLVGLARLPWRAGRVLDYRLCFRQ